MRETDQMPKGILNLKRLRAKFPFYLFYRRERTQRFQGRKEPVLYYTKYDAHNTTRGENNLKFKG